MAIASTEGGALMRNYGGFLSLTKTGQATVMAVPTVRPAVPTVTTWRHTLGLAVGIVGIAVYNWWVFVAVEGRLVTTPNELFSDLEANGQPEAAVLQHLDLAAGLLLVVALVLRGPKGPSGRRAEWPWLVAFGASGAIGGRFAYACPEGLSATCRAAEWHLALPLHHYVHMAAGVAEFTTATVAIYLAWRRTRGQGTTEARAVEWVGRALLLAYPILGFAYLTDRLGAFVEPVFFICFSAMVIVELVEPDQVVEPDERFESGERFESHGRFESGGAGASQERTASDPSGQPATRLIPEASPAAGLHPDTRRAP